MNDSIKTEFAKMAEALYTEGYMCGISDNDEVEWFNAWADAMIKIANGEKYTDDLVVNCFNKKKG